MIHQDTTLIATQKMSNGYWAVLELPARSRYVGTYYRLFRTEQLAEMHMAEQYSDAEWSSPEEIRQEAKNRKEEEEKTDFTAYNLYYTQDELQQAQNAVIWIKEHVTTIQDVQGPLEDEWNDNGYELYAISFLTRKKLSEQEEAAFLVATQPATCQLGYED